MMPDLPDFEALCHRCGLPRQVFPWLAHPEAGPRADPALLCVRCWSASSELADEMDERMDLLTFDADPTAGGQIVMPQASAFALSVR